MDPLSSDDPSVPLHRLIYRRLRHEIVQHYQIGDKLPSQNKLAERFGVSFMTVREALSILAEDGVIDRRRGRDTTVINPAANQHVAVLLEQDIAHPRTSYHFRYLTQQLRIWLHEQGYPVRPYLGVVAPGEETDQGWKSTTGTSCPELLEDLDAGRIRGVAVVGGTSQLLVRRIRELGVPLVGQEQHLPYYVNAGLDEVVRLGVDYLLGQGRRKLAFMSWGQPNAIIRYVRELDLQVRLDWLRCDLPPAAPAAGWEEFREIWSASREKPDGLLITDDMLFSDALHGMIDAKVKVPEDLAVVTHASRGAPFWTPFPVARVELDPKEMAVAMGRMLATLMVREEPASSHETLLPRLVEPAGAEQATKSSSRT